MAQQDTKDEINKLLPEVLAYFQAVDAAEVAFTKGRRDLAGQYPGRFGWGAAAREEHRCFNEAEARLYDDRDEAIHAAWNALKGSDNPLVAWIAEHCHEYREHAETVLRVLPATEAELDAIAAEGDWCSVWNSFKDRAIEAGVMPGYTPPPPAQKAVLGLLFEDLGISRSYRGKVAELLRAVAEEARAAVAPEPEAVPA
jgi:hypothetical protein